MSSGPGAATVSNTIGVERAGLRGEPGGLLTKQPFVQGFRVQALLGA